MKAKIWAALALSTVAAPAFAQKTSVELYGRMDLTVGKQIGTKDKSVQNGSGNRLGVMVNEDLGGGLAAYANMEHGFNGDTGAQTDAARFWNRRVFVGLKSNTLGSLQLGRDYTSAYSAAQVRSDPFGHNYLGQGMLRIGTGGIGIVRYDDSVKYYNTFGPVGVSVQLAEGNGSINKTADRPFSAAISYNAKAAGLYAAISQDNPGGVNDRWNYGTVVWDYGPGSLYFGAGDGKNNANQKIRSGLIGANYAIGSWDFRGAYGQVRNRTTGVRDTNKLLLGTFYSFSKRTNVFVNYGHDAGATTLATERKGYEVGIQHLF